jgi:GTP cyclohydrolase I/GTP cyclohydrolase-4
LSLSRVGLTGVEKVIRIGADRRSAQPFSARIECFLEPPADAGRFEAAIRDAVGELAPRNDAVRAERLAQQMAERVRERQRARRAVVTLAARFPEREDISTLHACAAATARATRWTVGVSVRKMTMSPYARAAHLARERLIVAMHHQLAVGTLHLGCTAASALEFDAVELVAIVGAALAGEPSDGVRAMLAGVVARYAGAPDDVFVSGAQENVETIHGHHVIAERAGLLGDLRRELAAGRPVAPPASLDDWLAGG